MTEPTELSKLRHLYQNMVNGAVRDTASAKRIAEGLLAPTIAALERGTPPAVAGEPVAYRHMHDDGWEYYDAPTGSDCPGCEPLYTTPQPTKARAGAVPLTKEQRSRIVLTADTVSEAIDKVERHHGIKGGQHGAE